MADSTAFVQSSVGPQLGPVKKSTALEELPSNLPAVTPGFGSLEPRPKSHDHGPRVPADAAGETHGPDAGTTDGWGLDEAGLLFLTPSVDQDIRTIETGAGVGTIVFALRRTRYMCIVPASLVVPRIREYCPICASWARTVHS